jgi:hypothetical protein
MSADDLPSRVVAGISFVGRGGGWVKDLGGFKKGHHSVPDAANAITNGFLGKICAPELGAATEQLFQEVRTALGYKRTQLALSVTSPRAALNTKDFSVEWLYALEEREPARYSVTTTLRGLMSIELTRTAEFARIFAGRFTEISFALKKGARVEAVIDAVEELELGDGLTVAYPSDYRDCTIAVEGVEATVRCTGAALEVVFPRAGGPAELIEQFAAVREAFRISKDLSGLIV